MNESFMFQGYSASNQMMCKINGTDIIQFDYSGNQKVIGKTSAAYSELEQTTTEYYNKLVELGVITPPKDPQEAMMEMQKTMQSMADMIQSLSNEVRELKKNGYEHNSFRGIENVSQREPERGGSKGTGNHAGNT